MLTVNGKKIIAAHYFFVTVLAHIECVIAKDVDLFGAEEITTNRLENENTHDSGVTLAICSGLLETTHANTM